MSKVSDLHNQWLQTPEYQATYQELGPEFELARLLIETRTKTGLTQTQLAMRMKTTQSVVARLESGRVHPSYKTLKKIARATGTRLSIRFETTGTQRKSSTISLDHFLGYLDKRLNSTSVYRGAGEIKVVHALKV